MSQSHIDQFFKVSKKIVEKPIVNSPEYTLFFDGGCVPNPGRGGAGAVLYQKDEEIWNTSGLVGLNETNNTAEYTGLIWGLTEAKNRNIKNIIIKGDSLLVIKQMKGEYKVNSAQIKILYDKAKNISDNFQNIEFIHVRRENNKRADELSKQGYKSLI